MVEDCVHNGLWGPKHPPRICTWCQENYGFCMELRGERQRPVLPVQLSLFGGPSVGMPAVNPLTLE